jgi:hypothetical protein
LRQGCLERVDVTLSGVWRPIKAAVLQLISQGGSIILTTTVDAGSMLK